MALDDHPWTSMVEPGFDVPEQRVDARGTAAVEVLFDAIERDALA